MRYKSNNFFNLFCTAILLLPIIFFWDSYLIYPIKLFVVLLHEISHGIAAIATGGNMVDIVINMNQGGLCRTSGGIKFIVLSAGYLGSIFWGGIILVVSSKYSFDRQISGIIGSLLLIIGIIYVENFFGKMFTIGFGFCMILIGWKAAGFINDFILKTIGLTSIVYSIIDIKSDTISRNIHVSDAARMGELYFGNSSFWGVIWISIATVAAFIFINMSSNIKST